MASRRLGQTTVGPQRTDQRLKLQGQSTAKKETNMEAKVDVRKLQILNDRINQTIDALNQVRVSVHGLGHTSAMQQPLNPLSFLGQGYGGQQGYGLQQPYGFGSPGLFPGLGGQFAGLQGLQGGGGFGFQHSPFNPYLNPFT